MTGQHLPQHLVTATSQRAYASVPGGMGQPYYPHAAGSWGHHPRAPEPAEAVAAESLSSLDARRASAAANPQSLEARRLAYLEEALANSHASTYDRSLATAERGFRQTLLSCVLGKSMINAADTQKRVYSEQEKVHESALTSLREAHKAALARAHAGGDQADYLERGTAHAEQL